MTTLWFAWPVVAVLLLILAVILGNSVKKGPYGLLIDERGRYSLTRLQLVTWSIVVMSLIAGVFIARLLTHRSSGAAIDFTIPSEVLGVLGISLGSTVVASTRLHRYQHRQLPSTHQSGGRHGLAGL